MTLHEALDKCSICDLFNKNVSDEYKMQVIDKVMSAPNTKVPKVKLSCLIAWLLKKVGWQEKRIEELEEENEKLKEQIEKMKCCENCKYNSYWGNELHCNECNKMDKWEVKENV